MVASSARSRGASGILYVEEPKDFEVIVEPLTPGARAMMRRWAGLYRAAQGLILLTATLALASCAAVPRGSTERNNLSRLRTVTVTITGKTSYSAYVADTSETTELGLMNVTEADLPADRGMIFVFSHDRLLSFWMRNTIIPLNIAYIRSDGTIVKTYAMRPLDERGYPSIGPARFALEVRAGQFAQWGIKTGDHVELPAELFK